MSGSLLALVLVLVLCPSNAHAQPSACPAEEPLSNAAAELLLAGTDHPEAAQLTAAVRGAGSDAVSLHALFIPTSAEPGAERSWLEALQARTDAPLACGTAQSERGRLLIATPRAAELSPPDATRRVRGKLAPGFTRAELVVAAADGQLLRVGVSPEALARGVELDADLTPPLKVQLLATGPSGPRPVAERWLGAPPSAASTGVPDSTRHSAVEVPGQANLGQLVLALRDARGKHGLRDNRLLREAATGHARAVCEQGRVAHRLPDGSGPEERLARAGLTARLVGEAIARASDGYTAFEALQNSPSHLLTLLEPRFTDLGVGEAKDASGKRCFVVLLAAWPRKR